MWIPFGHEKRVTSGEETDKRIIEVLNQLMSVEESKNDKIGFIKE